MTVNQLIEALTRLPPDLRELRVVAYDEGWLMGLHAPTVAYVGPDDFAKEEGKGEKVVKL